MTSSLKTSAGLSFVTSYQSLATVAFKPENIHLGDYVFVPYVRNGLSAAISGVPVNNRATVRAEVELVDSNDGNAAQKIGRDLTLYGPGDVIGIDPGQIIRREPADRTVDAEEGYLAHIEFARPDFPWMFSPLTAAGDICQPWLALIVCEAPLSHLEPAQGDHPARIWTRKGQLQALDDLHRFAHAQVVGAGLDGNQPKLHGAAEDSVETRLSDQHGPANLSRILCPKRLDDGVAYIAALVPAFDCGLQAGLGLSGGTLAPAWTRSPGDDADDIVLPTYASWTFSTAPGGSFRALAERINAIPAPWPVGRRRIDLSQPGSGIPNLAAGAEGGIQVLECALFSPAPGPIAAGPWPVEARDALRIRVDAANEDDRDLPRIGARLYARFQRSANRLGAVFGQAPFGADAAAAADSDWFSQINSNPLFRLVAGLGARVVQKDQEPLMQAAWAQVEGIRRANQVIAWAAMGEMVNTSVMNRHVALLDQGRLMQVTRNVHTRVRDAGQQRTVAAAVTFSRTAEATMGAAFRRALRPDGPLARRSGIAAADQGRLVAIDTGFRDHRIIYQNPDGIGGLSDVGRQFISPEVIARTLNVPVAGADEVLKTRLDILARTGPALTALQATRWDAAIAVKPGDAMGARLLAGITTAVQPAAGQPVAGADVLAQIVVGLANSGGALTQPASQGLAAIDNVTLRSDLGPAIRAPAFRLGPAFRPDPIGRPVQPVAPQIRSLLITPQSRGRASPFILDRPPLIGPAAAPGAAIPPALRFETDLSRSVTKSVQELNALTQLAFITEVRQVVDIARLPPKFSTDLGPLTVTRPGLLAQLDPRITARAALKGRITRVPGFLPADWFDRVGLKPIMAAPVFERPMYQALADYDRNWLVPGLGNIPDRDFVTVLSINPAFAEAFLVGASDEMGRELLWRDYPTDQRGTYFKRFWDADEDELTTPIHQFTRQPLGRHFSIGGDKPAGAGALALVVRGELLRRFPDTFIAALRATGPGGPPTFIEGSEAAILFHAHLDPDYVLVGFDLTVAQVTSGENWWFVLAQHPTAPRFGLATNPSISTEHNSLDWADFGTIPPGGFLTTGRNFPVKDLNSTPQTVQWPGHGGTVARVLLTNPIRAAFRADKLIGPQP